MYFNITRKLIFILFCLLSDIYLCLTHFIVTIFFFNCISTQPGFILYLKLKHFLSRNLFASLAKLDRNFFYYHTSKLYLEWDIAVKKVIFSYFYVKSIFFYYLYIITLGLFSFIKNLFVFAYFSQYQETVKLKRDVSHDIVSEHIYCYRSLHSLETRCGKFMH